MSDAVIISVVSAISGLATIVLNNKMNKVHKDVVKVKQEINGRMTELLDLTRQKGNLEGRAEQTQEDKKTP